MPELQSLFSRVFRFAWSLTRNRESAEDLAQESILRAIRKGVLDSVGNQIESELTNSIPVIHWLFKVARNLWLDEIKSARVQNREFATVEQPTNDFNFKRLELKEEISQAMQMMMDLPETQRQVLFLHAVEDMPIRCIAESLDMNTNSVKASLSLARKSMRNKRNFLATAASANREAETDE